MCMCFNFHVIFFVFIGKFAQRPNMTKVEVISNPEVYFDYLSDRVNVLDVNLVSEHY